MSRDPLLIVLTPLRSYSSVVAAMLGQHPDMYGVPELNLFIDENLGDLVAKHNRFKPDAIHGLVRVLAQLHEGAQSESSAAHAHEWIREHSGWSTARVLAHIVESVQPRIVVDKSPRTVMQQEYMERIHRMYPNANYLHLTRHPRSMGNSLITIVERNTEWDGVAKADHIEPERIWNRAHGKIITFTDSLPEGQSMRIKGEDLLSYPDTYLPQIAEWLDIRTDKDAIASMYHPEESPYSKIGPPNAKYGNDPNFLEQPQLRSGKIKEASLEGELEWAPGSVFQPDTVVLAKKLGYR